MRTGPEAAIATIERATSARWAGWALLASVVFVMLVHLGGQVVAGQRVSGTSDISAIAAYYAHRGLLPVYWLGSFFVLPFGIFVVAFRRYLRAHSSSTGPQVLADAGTALALAVIPAALLVWVAPQAAMVQMVKADPSGSPALLGLFAAWDWAYNSFSYLLELGWVGVFSLAAWQVRALPRPLAAYGVLVAIVLGSFSLVLPLGLSDQVTLPGSALFAVWFLVTGIYLARGGTGRGLKPQPK